MSSTSLLDFYRDKTIFLTGGTGFIGRLLLSKILKKGIVKEVLLLSRTKKEKSNVERLNGILEGFLFQEMEKFDVNYKSKLKIVNGDMEIKGLGMTSEDREYIEKHVEIIIHGAATVRFDEDLKKAIAINVRGTECVIDIATKSKKLQSFVHISTAYAQCPRLDLKETFYKSPMDYRQAIDISESCENDVLNAISDRLIAPWPNTYTFSKAIAEDMVRQYTNRLPIAVIRPSIVQSTFVDPAYGFVDKLIGPIGLAVGVMAGLIRVIKCSRKVGTDLVPADIVVNSTLAIARQTSKRSEIGDRAPVYNCVINKIRKCTIHFCMEGIIKYAKKYPTKQMIWLPTFVGIACPFMYRFYFVLYHYIPAFFIDIVMKLKGSKLRMVNIYSKVFFLSSQLDYFMSKTWDFDDINMRSIVSGMTEKDHVDFPLVMRADDYEVHQNRGIDSIRKYFFKENDDDLKLAKRRYKIFYVLHNLVLAIYYGLFLYFMYFVVHALT